MLAVVFVMAACSGDTSGEDKEEEKDTTEEKSNDEKGSDASSEEGQLTYAVDTAPEGLFVPGFAGSIIDSRINDLIHDSLISANENMEYTPHVAEWETEDNKVFTFKLK